MLQKRSNQHIKRQERAHDVEFARRKIKAGILISRLNKAAAGKVDLTKSQLEATKMLLDKAVPSLQAIEQTVVNEMDKLSAEELQEQAKALIIASPALVIAALDADPGLRAAIKSHLDGRPSVVEVQQTQRNMVSAA